MIPFGMVSCRTDICTILHRRHVNAPHGIMLPVSAKPQSRGIPSHLRFSLDLFLVSTLRCCSIFSLYGERMSIVYIFANANAIALVYKV